MSRRRAEYSLAGFVSLATFAVYLRSLGNGFVAWDDNVYVYDNSFIRSLSPEFFKKIFFSFPEGNWHPLTWMSHALDYAVWGLNPLGHHLTNVVLHSANTFLVVLLAMRLVSTAAEFSGERARRALLIAGGVTGLLFGLHPVHVESVAWVSERKDLLCGFFFLLSILGYLSYRAHSSHKSYALSLVFFGLALLSKPMAVTLPVVLLILDWYPLQRIRSFSTFRNACADKLPFLALSLVSSAATLMAQRAAGAIARPEILPLATRVLVAFKSLIAYLGKLLMPVNLLPYYSYPKDVSLLSLKYLFPVLAVAAITIGGIAEARRRPALISAWAYYVITLVPVLGIIQVGTQAMADRYTYLPSLGPFLLAGIASARGMDFAGRTGKGKYLKAGLAGFGLMVFGALACMTFLQIGIWKDSVGLWTYVIDKDPGGSAYPYNNRGELYFARGRFDRSLADFDKAIEIAPSTAAFYNNRGIVYSGMGLREQAMADYDKAVSLSPDYAAAYYNRGILFLRTGRPGRAIEDFGRTIALNPSDAKAYNNRGIARDITGSPDRAIEDFDRAIGLDPGHASSYFNRGKSYLKTGNREPALSDFRKACSLGDEEGCRALRADGGAGGERPDE